MPIPSIAAVTNIDIDIDIDIAIGLDEDGNGGAGSVHIGNGSGAFVKGDRFKQMRDNFVLSQFNGIQEELDPPPADFEYCDNTYNYEVRATEWDGGTPVLARKCQAMGTSRGSAPRIERQRPRRLAKAAA